MRQGQPAAELPGRLLAACCRKTASCGGAARDARDLRAPFASADGGDFDPVLPAVDGFFETMQVHGGAVDEMKWNWTERVV